MGEVGQLLEHHINDANLWIPNKGSPQIPINEVLGRMQVAQGPAASVNPLTGQLTAGVSRCRPEIIPWPYAVDDAGCAFDQANLWGVRFYTYNPEQYAVVAVPKTLPSGYISPIARGAWQCPQQFSPLGLFIQYMSPDSGATWVNTGDPANAVVSIFDINAPPGDDRTTRDWGPQNWANKSFAGIAINQFSEFYNDGTNGVLITLLNSDCAGFRRAQITYFTSRTTDFPTLRIGWTLPGTGLPGYPVLPTVLYSHTPSAGEFVPAPPIPGAMSATYNIPDLRGPTLGQKYDFYIWYVPFPGDGFFAGEVVTSTLSPRTDIPFPFHVIGYNDGVTSDWHAPGGYVP